MINWKEVAVKDRKNVYKEICKNKSLEEKTKLLKNIYEGLEGVCLVTGPSLLEFSQEKIEQFCKDKPVFAVKTATLKFSKVVDVCITNSYNTYQPHPKRKYLVLARQETPIQFNNWINQDLIEKNTFYNSFFYEPDILWGSDTTVGHSKSVCKTNKWKENSLENTPINRVLGPGIMYDMIVPILIHTGLSKVGFLGWDGSDLDKKGNIKHFYDVEKKYRPMMNCVTDDFDLNNLKADLQEHEQQIGTNAQARLYEYFVESGCQPEILTKNSSINSSFPRNDILYKVK